MGVNGGMPWRLSPDLRYFKAMTISCPVIMGRGTWDSMPEKFRPLPGRENIVVSRNPDFNPDGAKSFTSIEEAICYARKWIEDNPIEHVDSLDLPKDGSAIWIIGGGAIFKEVIESKIVDAAYVTQIDTRVEADTFAPNIQRLVDDGLWKVARDGDWQESAIKVGAKQFDVKYKFMVYKPIKAKK
ncbi:Dihydrofolate reductase [Chlamydia trachomatis]|nr:Dihydrofolate reductase [Chlamydia trachomatis]